MKTAIINGVTRHQAREAFRDYRKAWREKHGEDDEALMLTYRAIARGQSVLDLRRTIVEAGFHLNALPKLAIVHAGAHSCHVSREWGTLTFSDGRGWRKNAAKHRKTVLRAMPVAGDGQRNMSGVAKTPIIPPALRPADSLENYHILWEADWKQPPADPFLLKHIHGPFFAIVAQWDLTELERAVMAGAVR